jgi:hypothetical protein
LRHSSEMRSLCPATEPDKTVDPAWTGGSK